MDMIVSWDPQLSTTLAAIQYQHSVLARWAVVGMHNHMIDDTHRITLLTLTMITPSDRPKMGRQELRSQGPAPLAFQNLQEQQHPSRQFNSDHWCLDGVLMTVLHTWHI
jgi:hypothetical protein